VAKETLKELEKGSPAEQPKADKLREQVRELETRVNIARANLAAARDVEEAKAEAQKEAERRRRPPPQPPAAPAASLESPQAQAERERQEVAKKTREAIRELQRAVEAKKAKKKCNPLDKLAPPPAEGVNIQLFCDQEE
jgi:hypothetical protein